MLASSNTRMCHCLEIKIYIFPIGIFQIKYIFLLIISFFFAPSLMTSRLLVHKNTYSLIPHTLNVFFARGTFKCKCTPSISE